MSLRAILALAGAASAALLLCALTTAPHTAVSPDGRWRAVVENPNSDQEDGRDSISTLRIESVAGGPGHVVLVGGSAQGDVKRIMHDFDDPRWSLDGGYIYVSAGAWATSPAVHQVNVETGAERFIIDGAVSGVIRTGPYRGMLLVQRHKYHPAPEFGSYDPVDVVRPDGKVMLTIPGSDRDEGQPSVARWLKTHGWTAS